MSANTVAKGSNDHEIRAALRKRLEKNRTPHNNFIIIDELGLLHGKNRIDLAIIGKDIHGFEIKSSRDNLDRLPEQLKVYEQCLQRLTLVVADSHLAATIDLVPSWCGIVVARKEANGKITLKRVRSPKKNRHVSIFHMAHLLWKKEAAEILSKKIDTAKIENISRKELYWQLAENFTIAELSNRIKEYFTSREKWRADL